MGACDDKNLVKNTVRAKPKALFLFLRIRNAETMNGEKSLKSFLFFFSFKTPVCMLSAMDCSLPGFSVYGVFQARILEQVAISSSRGSSQPRNWTHVSYISCIGRQILYHQCCCSHASQETSSLRRTMQTVECRLLHWRAQGRVSS